MQGIEWAQSLYRQQVEPMIREQFPEYEERIAVGLCGNGSECFGFDDEFSRDHDFGGLYLWLTEEDQAVFGGQLSEAYLALPGVQGLPCSELGEGVRGVRTVEGFFESLIGIRGAPETWQQWLHTPDYALAAACNGKIFRDDLGHFTQIHRTVRNGMPEDVRKKKIACCGAMMAQSGQYNFKRCLLHGETGAAMLAMGEFVQYTCRMIYLLNFTYAPFYKWMLKGLSALGKMSELAPVLNFLLTDPDMNIKEAIVEDVCGIVINEMKRQWLTDAEGNYMEPHAFSVMEKIADPEIRKLHIME